MTPWDQKQVLITGGLGFIGSTLAHKLYEYGAKIHIIDADLDRYGSNEANIWGIKNDIKLTEADVRNRDAIKGIVQSSDVVFHLAAQLSRTISNKDPVKDTSINCKGLLNVLSSAELADSPPRIVFTSSQAVVGDARSLPFDEDTPATPVDIYGANKRAGEMYCKVYHHTHDIPTVAVRLTNVYGARAQLSNPNYGVVNNFIRSAIKDEPLTVFKPGTMKRDFINVWDVTEGLLHLGEKDRAVGERYVMGSGTPVTIKRLAEIIVEVAGSGKVKMVSWPDDWDDIRIGDVYSDPSKMTSHFGWSADTPLDSGLAETIEYYENRQSEYL